MFVVIVGINIPFDANIKPFWAMVDCLEPRDVIKAVRIGAVASANTDEEHAWANSLVEALDYIDNQVRPLRNRYVHDPWINLLGEIRRVTTSPRLVKVQSFGRRTVEYDKLHPGNKKELRTLISEIKRYDIWLWDMYYWREGDPPPSRAYPSLEKLLSKRPPQRLPLLQSGMPRPKDKRAPKQQPPPGS
jgi:hypothetical protein